MDGLSASDIALIKDSERLARSGVSSEAQEILNDLRFDVLDEKFDKLGEAIGSEGRGLQTQLAETKFCLATAIHAEADKTRELIQQQEIADLRGQINKLQIDNAMAGVVRFPMAATYSVDRHPWRD